eukprot:1156964-Pelagomonas_calceolata.AAC.6
MQTPAPGQQPNEELQPGELGSVVVDDGNDKDRASKGAKAAAKGGAYSPSKPAAAMGLDSAPSKAVQGAAGAVGKALGMVGISVGAKEKVPDMGASWPTQLYILWSRALKVRRWVWVWSSVRGGDCVHAWSVCVGSRLEHMVLWLSQVHAHWLQGSHEVGCSGRSVSKSLHAVPSGSTFKLFHCPVSKPVP